MTTSAPSFQHVSWTALDPQALGPGIERKMVIGQSLMACRLRFAPGVVTPVHRHPHEQMTLVLQGRVRFTIEGKDRLAQAGDVVRFPSNVAHGATMLEEEVELIDVFTPIRQDFLG